jgi:hypothetical protein
VENAVKSPRKPKVAKSLEKVAKNIRKVAENQERTRNKKLIFLLKLFIISIEINHVDKKSNKNSNL